MAAIALETPLDPLGPRDPYLDGLPRREATQLLLDLAQDATTTRAAAATRSVSSS